MPWITPKLNWTSTDSYNATDLNRVENNLQEALTLIASIGYPTGTYTFVTNRTSTGIEYFSSINRIESNIDSVCSNFAIPNTWYKKTWAVGTIFDFNDANRWERTISSLKDFTVLIPQSYRYAGTFVAGSQGGLI